MGKVAPKLVDEYNENVRFTSLNTALRNISNDRTPLTDSYVSLSRDLVDLIDGEDGEHGDVLDVSTKKKEDGTVVIEVSYSDGTVKEISDHDTYVTDMQMNEGSLFITRNDGTEFSVDIKKEVEEQVEKIIIETKNKWEEF